MIRKVVGNLIIGLIMPILMLARWLPNTYNAVVHGTYEYYDFHITSLTGYLYEVYGKNYLFSFILAILFLLLPFQFVKDRYYRTRKKPLTVWKKILILVGVVLVEVMLFVRGPIYDWYILYLGVSISMGAIIFLLAYFLIDRYVEKEIDAVENPKNGGFSES